MKLCGYCNIQKYRRTRMPYELLLYHTRLMGASVYNFYADGFNAVLIRTELDETYLMPPGTLAWSRGRIFLHPPPPPPLATPLIKRSRTRRQVRSTSWGEIA